MMKRIVTFLVVSALTAGLYMQAQTVEELQSQKDAKSAKLGTLEAELATLQGKVDGLQADVAGLTDQLTPYPRWDKGLLGNMGLNFSGFTNWLPKDKPNVSAVSIGLAGTAYANGDYEKSFWRNSANLTLGWLKFDDKDNPDDLDEFQVSADAFAVSSLFGWKLNDKWAISTLGEYRTSVLDGKFNNPGYLDIGAGATWTPMSDLVVVIHPLNYNFVFADTEFNFESSLGAKVVVDYTKKITEGIAWKSNLSVFYSYEGADLSNWTFVNSFSTAYKGIGIGLDVGLRGNKQEALAAEKIDNPLQSYWIFGLSYALSSK